MTHLFNPEAGAPSLIDECRTVRSENDFLRRTLFVLTILLSVVTSVLIAVLLAGAH